MEYTNEQTSEDQLDLFQIIFTLLSKRWLIISSVLLFAVLGAMYNYHHQEQFQTNTTLLISKDQSDPSTFINNNQYDFLYGSNELESEDHISVFKSTLILNNVVEKLGLNYRYFKKNKLKANELLTRESVPFEFYFKNENIENTCIIKYDKHNVTIEVNDNIFSFSTNKREFENSLFSYKTKFLNYVGHNTYIINQFTKRQTVNGIKSSYVVNAQNKSNTYDISYTGANTHLNSKVLKGIVDEIIENNIRDKKNVYHASINFIESRIDTLREKIDSLNLVISNYKISNGVYMPENQTNSVLANLNDIEQKIFANSLQTELSLKLIDEVEKQTSFELLPTDIGIDNQNINNMVLQFNMIILGKNNLLVESTAKNPLLIQSQNQLIGLRSNILNSLDIYINKLKMKLNRYYEFKQKNNSLVGIIPLREYELGNLEKDLLLLNNLYSYLSQKIEEALINVSSIESNIKVINEVDYILTLQTNKPRILAAFLFAGFLLPIVFCVGLCFIRSFKIDTEYLKRELNNINFLGIIKFSKENASKQTKSVQYELLKRIYHNINMLIPKSEKGMSIMITSCIKNEGKTYTAFNLSRFLASKGKKVVLIGTDIGNPDLSKLFDQKNNKCKGLTNIIGDTENDFKELFENYKVKDKQLDTLFVGTKTSTKINLFNTQRFDDFISYLKGEYDYIIFDSAPILFMVESLELLEKSDYVVHVFRKNFSSKKLVNYVLDYKEKYNKKNIGYVITDDTKPDKFIDKYGYAYGYGYGYGYSYGYGAS